VEDLKRKSKTCSKCKEEKPLDQFWKQTQNYNQSGVTSRCKACLIIANRARYHRDKDKIKVRQKDYRQRNKAAISARSKKWRTENQDKLLSARLKYHYGLSLVDYNQMLVEQNNRCFCCPKEYNGFKDPLHVDHCHTSGKVRRLLCKHCNMVLGAVKESKETLQNLIKYLERFNNEETV